VLTPLSGSEQAVVVVVAVCSPKSCCADEPEPQRDSSVSDSSKTQKQQQQQQKAQGNCRDPNWSPVFAPKTDMHAGHKHEHAEVVCESAEQIMQDSDA
jgi:hypothetical protein